MDVDWIAWIYTNRNRVFQEIWDLQLDNWLGRFDWDAEDGEGHRSKLMAASMVVEIWQYMFCHK